MLGTLSNKLIMTEKIFDGLFFTTELILKNLNLCFEFDIIFLNLVIKHFHLYCFFVQLLLFFRLESIMGGLSLLWPIGVGQ